MSEKMIESEIEEEATVVFVELLNGLDKLLLKFIGERNCYELAEELENQAGSIIDSIWWRYPHFELARPRIYFRIDEINPTLIIMRGANEAGLWLVAIMNARKYL